MRIHFSAAALLTCTIVVTACGSTTTPPRESSDPATATAATGGIERDAPTSEGAPPPEEPDTPAAPDPAGLVRFPDASMTFVRLVGLVARDGRFDALVLERASADADVVLSARSLERLESVDESWAVPVPSNRVLAIATGDDGPMVAYRPDTSADTAVYVRPLGQGGAQTVLVPAFGAPLLERGLDLRAFDFASTERAIAAWTGVSRRPRPASEASSREPSADPLAGSIRSQPDPHRTIARWRRIGIGGPRGLADHVLHRQNASAGSLDETNRIAGVVAGDERHAALFHEDRPDGRTGLHVWFFDARSGRRVGRYDEMSGDPHGFTFRAGGFDAERRLWLLGAARTGDGSDAHWVYVFDRRHRLLSRRQLPHRGSWKGQAALVRCGGVTWAALAAVDRERRERLHVYALTPEGDPPEPRVVFEADSPRGEGDAVWHTHDLHVACGETEVAAAFRFGPRHVPTAEIPFGVARWPLDVPPSALAEESPAQAETPPARRACGAQRWGGWEGTPECRAGANRRIPAAHQTCQSDADCVRVGTSCDAHAVNARFERRYGRWRAPCTPPGAGACSDPGQPTCDAGCCVVGMGLGSPRR